ncbi:MAG: patatin-like phospholipase family protein [Planctomycetes bacterium]|nr:patatin-like phospholipase family protein [Planctomycetota bacterium]
MDGPIRTCLALGGGGARGLSHLGVMEVLDREGFPIDCIVGTSAGAVVGAAYALQPDATLIAEHALEYFRESQRKSNTFKKVLLGTEDAEQNFFTNLISNVRKGYVFSALLRRPSIFPGEKLYEVISDLVPDKQFSDTKIPFAVPALDIRSGEEVILREGSLRKAVHASCSLPGFFPPVEFGDHLLVDAGVIGPVPVNASRCFAPSVVVGVDITSHLDDITEISQGLDAILRVEAIACKRLNDLDLRHADLVINPEVGDKDWSDFSGLDDLVEEGRKAAEKQLPVLRTLMTQVGAAVTSK